MRAASKVDANQKQIVAGLRKAGCSVLILSQVGKGCPDIAVGFGGFTILMEIKDGSKPPSARKLTPDEEQFFRTWRGSAVVIKSLDEAIEAINQTIKRDEIRTTK